MPNNTELIFFFFLNKILTVTCALLGISSKEAQFVGKKKKGITKWTDWDGRERKQEHVTILDMHQYLDPASGFTLLDLSLMGKDSTFF